MQQPLSTPSDTRLRVDAERNRQRILTAARVAFADRGLDVTLDDIATLAGVGVGTVYRRFANKEALIDELFEDRVSSVVDAAEAALEEADAWTGLMNFLEQRMALEAEDRGLHQILMCTTYGQDRTAAARAEIAPRCARLLAKAQTQGYLRADIESHDIPVLGLMLGSVNEFTSKVAPDAWRRYLTIILDGLRVSRSAPTLLPVPALTEGELTEAMSVRP